MGWIRSPSPIFSCIRLVPGVAPTGGVRKGRDQAVKVRDRRQLVRAVVGVRGRVAISIRYRRLVARRIEALKREKAAGRLSNSQCLEKLPE